MSLTIDLYEPACDKCGRFGNSYNANITHNLIHMAKEAEIYGSVWRPEENGIERAKQLIKPLEKAIKTMKENPGRFKKHNSFNGWGLYKNFLPFLQEYLDACKDMPDAVIDVSK